MLDSSVIGTEMPPPSITFTLGEHRYERSSESRLVPAGALPFPGGLAGAETMRVVEGAVCLYQQAGDGGRRILDILGPGHLVGAFLTDLPACNVAALTRTRLAGVAAPEEPAMIAAATRTMLKRAQSHALLLRSNAVSERVASCLIDLERQFGGEFGMGPEGGPEEGPEGGPEGETTFTLHLTRADLADWLGLTLTSVSRGLNAFKRAGLIAFDHPKVITICDREGLAVLASGEGEPARRKLPQAASAAEGF